MQIVYWPTLDWQAVDLAALRMDSLYIYPVGQSS